MTKQNTGCLEARISNQKIIACSSARALIIVKYPYISRIRATSSKIRLIVNLQTP